MLTKAIFCNAGHEMVQKDEASGIHARCDECSIQFTHIGVLLKEKQATWIPPSKEAA